MPLAVAQYSYKLNGVEIGPHLRLLDLHIRAGELVSVKMELFVDELLVDVDGVMAEIKEAIRKEEDDT
ncbi:hypothetical protein LCGC14_1886330 [marine sediment metagenome]|uniref:Uncharacterized protein n=1 Tax=marine sediment metagenome TaxID=412755 RepID=A0A0F9IZ56_9ZZZZ